MPELVLIETDHFDCIIWSKNVAASQRRLEYALKKRGGVVSPTVFRFSPPLLLTGSTEPQALLSLDAPVFFENTYYEIEFLFHKHVLSYFDGDVQPHVEHKLRNVEEAFHFSTRSGSLRGSINTRNDVGGFQFFLAYPLAGSLIRQSFSFDILPLKMDLQSEFKAMNNAVDKVFPLWRFSLAKQTSHQLAAVKKPHSQFLLLWFARFESLHHSLFSGLKHVLNAPHSRLMKQSYTTRMNGLKGRLSPKQEELLALTRGNKQTDKRFAVSKKTLQVDTPENRFIKAVVDLSAAKLEKIRLSSVTVGKGGKPRLSRSFLQQLNDWHGKLKRFRNHPLFKEVGGFEGLTRESLVLQQKPGYSKVYKTWQQLRWYLELLEGVDQLSLRNVAEMYEIWCFLEIRRILFDLDFTEKTPVRIPLISTLESVSLKDGMAGAFHFERNDGVTIRLAHEPVFRKDGKGIKTWLVSQKPDILLEATLPDGSEIIWLFDAKYRIDTPYDFKDNDNNDDLVPEDALNQMHRYRDALIHFKPFDAKGLVKTRPVFGAYALYPGCFDQLNENNPYKRAIQEIGIGAFSLLPQENHEGSIWLTRFLEKKLKPIKPEHFKTASDRYFVEHPTRISGRGYSKVHHERLTILASQLGPDRNTDYVSQFDRGEARLYHTRLYAFKRQNIQQYIAMEIRYLAVALDTEDGLQRKIDFIYPVLSAKRAQRKELTEKETGTASFSEPEEWYWLFTLGTALRLKTTLFLPHSKHFELKLVSLEALSAGCRWHELPELYVSV